MIGAAVRTIGVFSPAGAVDPRRLDEGVAALRAEGFSVVVAPHAAGKNGYFSGTEEERFADFCDLWLDPSVDVLLAARGGFGCAHLLEKVSSLPDTGKIVGGFSDLTALLWTLDAQGKGRPAALPMAAKFGAYDETTKNFLREMAAGKTRRAENLAVIREGDFSGSALPGNLAVAASLAGTPYFPDCRGRVLILEEVGEPLYRIDRMLTQLDQCGALRACAGVVFGEISGAGYPDGALEETLARVCRRVPGGVRMNLRYGHEEGTFFPVRHGETVRVEGNTLQIN
ncbi:MAG: LD-carboxypeptidase [Victivallaceae bacterium]|nr:LD-carboxypeptidase [Victivallaceae bacterium]